MKKSMIKKQDATAELIDKCTIYLNDNFYKFSQSNKIKIALEIFKRKMPIDPLVDNSSHYHFTRLEGEQLVSEARRRGIPIPDAIARRLGDTRKAEPVG